VETLAHTLLLFSLLAVTPDGPGKTLANGLEYIDTSFENASPLWYEAAPDGTVLVHLLYDHERSSPNRAAGHFHSMPGPVVRLHWSSGTWTMSTTAGKRRSRTS
jgi:hypothetical protein